MESMAQPDIGPEAFAKLVALVTGDAEMSEVGFAELLRDPAAHARMLELDAIWRSAGTLKSPLSPE